MRSIFNYCKPKEVFTEYTFNLMKQKKNFIIFPDNKQILEGIEIKEWNENNPFDMTEKIQFTFIKVRGVTGYIIKYRAKTSLDLIIPYDLIENHNYIQFLNEIEIQTRK